MIWKAGMNIDRKIYVQPLRRLYLFFAKGLAVEYRYLIMKSPRTQTLTAVA